MAVAILCVLCQEQEQTDGGMLCNECRQWLADSVIDYRASQAANDDDDDDPTAA